VVEELLQLLEEEVEEPPIVEDSESKTEELQLSQIMH
jgi:hypothetical protein